MFPLQQVLHRNLYLCASLPNQLIHQTVTAGISPIGGKSSSFQIVYDRPWIIYIFTFSKGKTIIPFFYFRALILHTILVQCSKYLFFCKAKAVRIHLRCRCHYCQMIQIRENRLLTDSCNPRHKRPFQIGIRLERGVEQSPYEFHHFLPVAIHPSLLKRCVIFVQQDNNFFPIVAIQKFGQRTQRRNSRIVIHICRNTFYKLPFFFI